MNEMDGQGIRVLLIEDDEEDYLVARDLLSANEVPRFEVDWESSYENGLAALRYGVYDACLLDYQLGPRDGIELLEEALLARCQTPIIMLTGQSDRGIDLTAMRLGAVDYLIKGRIDAAMLERSIRYAIERTRAASERAKLIRELQDALASVKTLSGLLPICSSCKSIRDDNGYWAQLEQYVASRTDAAFSHGMCPKCMVKHYPDYADEAR
ncbi:MAG TPA: response regulator [Blastocatellia bacterium]|nr:response regulator [Blastocatellia bacterium]